MSLFCKLLGHKVPPGHQGYGAKYLHVSPMAIDGINREHAGLYTDCERCGEEFRVGMVHLPERDAERHLKRRMQLLNDEIARLAGAQTVVPDMDAMQAVYAKGWRRAAEWANRDDLHVDVGSPAYLKDMAKDLTEFADTAIAARLLQDEDSGREGRRYSRWLASRPDARLNAREAAAVIEIKQTVEAVRHE